MPAISGSVPVTGFVAPTDSADTFPSHTEEWGRGGYRTVADLTERNGIPNGRRKEGMKVFVVSNGTEYTLGSGLLDADWALSKNSTMSINTLTDLAAVTSTGFQDGVVFRVLGRSAKDDGGGGYFRYDSSSTATHDGSMVVAPLAGPGRFLREWDTEILPQWFGADDSGATDAAPALQAALNFAAAPTYGWQSTSGPSGGRAAFTVKAVGCYSLFSEVKISSGAMLEGKPGVTWGDTNAHTIFHIRHGGSGFIFELWDLSIGYRIGGLKHVIILGRSQTYQQNKKTITGVTSRLVFTVADADAPPTLDDVTARPGNNTCFFYDDQGEYLGSARIASTSSAAGTTTVTLHNGSDAFSSINGTAGGALTNACKVVWPVRVTDEFTVVSAFNDPALAGQVGVNIRNKRGTSGVGIGHPVLEDISCGGLHTGFRFGPGVAGSVSPIQHLRSTRHKFAGFSCSKPENVADFVFSGSVYASGYFALDFDQSLSSSGSLTVTAATPAVFTKAGHGYIAGSIIRFGAATIPTGLTAGSTYYVSATGLTANTFQVSTSIGGSSVATSSTGSGLYVYGNVIDYPSMQFGTYGFYGAPNHSRFDSAILEFSAFANLYCFTTIAPHFKYLYSDGVMRHAIVLNAGYSIYSSPGSSQFSNWVPIEYLQVMPAFSGTPYDNLHSNRCGVFFEPTDFSRFAAISIGQLNVPWPGGVAPKLTHVFDLGIAALNNRAKVSTLLDQNGYTAWSNPASKSPEIDSPNFTTAAEIETGWYRPSTTQRDFAVSGTRLLSLASGNALVEKTGGSQLFTLKNTTSGSTVATSVGTETFSLDDTNSSRRFGTFLSTSTDVGVILGTSANTGTARGTQISGESMSGTDKTSGHFLFIGPRGTGSGNSGTFQFYTGDVGASGTTQHSVTRKLYIPAAGGIKFEPTASDISTAGVGHVAYVSGSINGFRFYDRDSWQPLSPNSVEQSIASASTVQLALSTSEKIFITGTTNIAGFGSAQSGVRRFVRFEGALTLTNSATLVCPGGVDISTEAGDAAEVHSFGSSSWRIVGYQRASGAPLFTLSKVATISVDASATFTFLPASSSPTQVLSAAITAGRTVTLSTASAKNGQTARFTRTAASTGAFNWDIGGLKNLTVGTWCEVVYDGSAWVLVQFGSL